MRKENKQQKVKQKQKTNKLPEQIIECITEMFGSTSMYEVESAV